MKLVKSFSETELNDVILVMRIGYGGLIVVNTTFVISHTQYLI